MIVKNITTAYFTAKGGNRYELKVEGLVPTTGYRNERLTVRQSPSPNALAFNFEADPPQGPAHDTFTDVKAAKDIELTPAISSISIFGEENDPYIIFRLPGQPSKAELAAHLPWLSTLGGPIDPVPWPWMLKMPSPLSCPSCPFPWNAPTGSTPPPPPLPDIRGYKLRVVLPGQVIDQQYDPARLTVFITGDGRIAAYGFY